MDWKMERQPGPMMHEYSDGVVGFSLRPLSAKSHGPAAPSFRSHKCRFGGLEKALMKTHSSTLLIYEHTDYRY